MLNSSDFIVNNKFLLLSTIAPDRSAWKRFTLPLEPLEPTQPVMLRTVRRRSLFE